MRTITTVLFPWILLAGTACELRVTTEPTPPPAMAVSSGDRPAEDGGPQTTAPSPASREEAVCDPAIDPDRELVVTDPLVLQGVEASNARAGAAFSFRSRIEEIAAGSDAAALLLDWAGTWAHSFDVQGESVAARPLVEARLFQPWKERAALGCGSDYESCTRALLAESPFELLAIVNRLDLASTSDGCSGSSGELRFVYAARNGEQQEALPMTLIVEIPLPDTRSPQQWSFRWHQLARLPAGDDYRQKLAELVREITRSADPSETRLRTNEGIFDAGDPGAWQLRQYARSLGAAPRLVLQPLPHTPRDALQGSTTLAAFFEQARGQLAQGVVPELPTDLQATVASMPSSEFRWQLPLQGSDGERHLFNASTCNGCHGGERPRDTMPFQHIAPAGPIPVQPYKDLPGSGGTRLSAYLRDRHGDGDELSRRARWMSRLLCTSCNSGTHAPHPLYDPSAPCR